MEFIYFVTFLFVLLPTLLLYYWNFKKKVAGFPICYLLPQLVLWKITGRISKDSPLNNVIFEKLVKLGKSHIKEGLFMMFTYHPILVIYSSEAIQFFGNGKAALDKASEYRLVEDIMGAGISMSNGKRWKKHRKLINPAFHMTVLKEKVPLFNKYAMVLIKDMEQLAGKPSVHILDTLKISYFYSLSESILGLKQDEKNKEQQLKIGEYVDNMCSMTVKRFLYPWLRWKFVLNFFASGRKFLQEYKICCDFIDDTISDMKKRITSKENEEDELFGNHLRKSFTYILLNHHLNKPDSFTLQDLHDEVKTIIITGYDTVTHTTMWCLHLLGTHPEIQEKLFHEIQSKTSDYITYEDSCDLPYLEAVIMETLRLYPILPAFARNLSEDVQFDKYKVFKGTTIAFFPYLSHRDPKIYPDPEKFDPERFLTEEPKKASTFIPFGEGSRSCIGQNYALIEMRIFLAHILRNFKFTSLDRTEDIKLSWTIVISPLKPLNFKITSRNTESHDS